MMLFSRRLVTRRILVYRQRRAQATLFSGKATLTEVGQQVSAEQAPVTLYFKVDHRLAEPGFAINIGDGIGLVDDVDQVYGFGDAPEHGVHADQQFEAVRLTRPVGFAQVGERTLGVDCVMPKIGNDGCARIVATPTQFGRGRN